MKPDHLHTLEQCEAGGKRLSASVLHEADTYFQQINSQALYALACVQRAWGKKSKKSKIFDIHTSTVYKITIYRVRLSHNFSISI